MAMSGLVSCRFSSTAGRRVEFYTRLPPPPQRVGERIFDDEEPSEFRSRHLEYRSQPTYPLRQGIFDRTPGKMVGEPGRGRESVRATVGLKPGIRHTSTIDAQVQPYPRAARHCSSLTLHDTVDVVAQHTRRARTLEQLAHQRAVVGG